MTRQEIGWRLIIEEDHLKDHPRESLTQFLQAAVTAFLGQGDPIWSTFTMTVRETPPGWLGGPTTLDIQAKVAVEAQP